MPAGKYFSEEIVLMGYQYTDEIIKYHLLNFPPKNWSKSGKLKKADKIAETRKLQV
jgi:hypothetical protein